jgi:hypothetical protein
MLVGAATLQGMHLTLPKTPRFLAAEGSCIRRGAVEQVVPQSSCADEVVTALSATKMERWWVHPEGLVDDPQAAAWTY